MSLKWEIMSENTSTDALVGKQCCQISEDKAYLKIMIEPVKLENKDSLGWLFHCDQLTQFPIELNAETESEAKREALLLAHKMIFAVIRELQLSAAALAGYEGVSA